MEDRKNYAFESRSSPLLVCNLFAIQGEGPQNAQKQSPAQTQRIHTLSRIADIDVHCSEGPLCSLSFESERYGPQAYHVDDMAF